MFFQIRGFSSNQRFYFIYPLSFKQQKRGLLFANVQKYNLCIPSKSSHDLIAKNSPNNYLENILVWTSTAQSKSVIPAQFCPCSRHHVNL